MAESLVLIHFVLLRYTCELTSLLLSVLDFFSGAVFGSVEVGKESDALFI